MNRHCCSYLRRSYLRQQVERLVRSKPQDPRSGVATWLPVATCASRWSVWFVRSEKIHVLANVTCSYLRQQVERLVRSSVKIHVLANVATVWFVQSEKIHVLANVATGERSYRLKRPELSPRESTGVPIKSSIVKNKFAIGVSSASFTWRFVGYARWHYRQ